MSRKFDFVSGLIAVLCLGSFFILYIQFHATVQQNCQQNNVKPEDSKSSIRLKGECELNPALVKTFDGIALSGYWGGRTVINRSNYSHYYTYGVPDNILRHSVSGWGSYIGPATAPGLRFLSDVINKYNITTMLDIPCGDANWQFQSWEVDSLKGYVGLDVSPRVAQFNSERYWFHKNKHFQAWDLSCELPQLMISEYSAEFKPFDMIHIRDVIQHLPLEVGKLAVQNIKASGIKYVVATTFKNGKNRNVKAGSFYENDLGKEPFNLPEPIDCVKSHLPPADKKERDLTCLYIL
eukprot:m.223387 g.223387  ORF g.223387 m.223387 type:complete len:294 (-) comp15943_c0_seq1:96-977(-)